MNFDEGEDIAMLRETLRRFLDKEMPRERARELDQQASFCKDTFAKLCELGVTGLTVPTEYGGAGVDVLSAIVVIEELAQRGTALAGPFIHCAFYGAMNLVENGSEAQKREYLPRLAKGELLFAYGLSEPDVGGDLASAAVTARLSDDGRRCILNGTKRWCTGARAADYIYTLARTGPKEDRYKNLSLILVPTASAGITIVDIDHLGLRYAATTDVIYENVEVPIENVVGGAEAWNNGWPMLAGRSLDVERLEITAVALGIATAAVNDAWQYATERRQFGVPISGHQAVRNMLVEARTKLVACRHMLYHAAWLATEGRDCSVQSSMAKLFVADNAVDIVLTCQRVMGAYGCAREYDMERYVRDIVCMPIVGGSSNMQKNNIAGRLRLPLK
ncbi:MAG: acyl-CoA/acyl-ACP dehydrogenase [Hyphomonadaceae bacterium]|nr:acyl-CoA/acyl-ACP dehydrogenase [Hyphomonadaceae bacterium]GIK48806.1 MAG: acyl-CoA dehydrogenase [Alphaproteobacteria bacterium]